MDLKELNAKRWKDCHVYSARGPLFEKVAKRILANKPIYLEIEKATGVPWWFVGITHYRESNLNLNTQLAQGDPLHQVSRHVPRGRGPFNTFQEGAYDALVNCAPYAARNKDWSTAGALTMFEKYNGLGYYQRSMPSPYVWAGTDQYVKGKYVADGRFDPNAVDSQLGCAGLMKYLGVGNSSPAAPAGIAALAAGGASFSMWDQIQNHPYIAVAGVVALITAAVLVIKYINRKKISNDQVVLPEHVEQGERLGKTDME